MVNQEVLSGISDCHVLISHPGVRGIYRSSLRIIRPRCHMIIKYPRVIASREGGARSCVATGSIQVRYFHMLLLRANWMHTVRAGPPRGLRVFQRSRSLQVGAPCRPSLGEFTRCSSVASLAMRLRTVTLGFGGGLSSAPCALRAIPPTAVQFACDNTSLETPVLGYV